ncbi:kinase-like domain-containing protein [Mycena galericulata]|nr:kinase-like domain-containing protein [Mycena galericulata]
MRCFARDEKLRRIRLVSCVSHLPTHIDSRTQKLCREALVWKDLHHPNILPFLGIDRDSFPSELCMVSPWMEHGTVLDYLKAHQHANVHKLLLEIAQGLEYLHSKNIVHGDLRGANILVTENSTACLADFGLSVFTDVTASTSSNRAGCIYWMAPELIAPERFGCGYARTSASDVYAFGCVCLELCTGLPPFSELSQPAAILRIISGHRAERPRGNIVMSDALWKYVVMCWAKSPVKRPSARAMVPGMAVALAESQEPYLHSEVGGILTVGPESQLSAVWKPVVGITTLICETAKVHIPCETSTLLIPSQCVKSNREAALELSTRVSIVTRSIVERAAMDGAAVPDPEALNALKLQVA